VDVYRLVKRVCLGFVESVEIVTMKMIRISVIVSLITVLAGTYIYLYMKEREQTKASASLQSIDLALVV
jgi:hypothetical protein